MNIKIFENLDEDFGDIQFFTKFDVHIKILLAYKILSAAYFLGVVLRCGGGTLQTTLSLGASNSINLGLTGASNHGGRGLTH